jgi:hypothetical protein
VFELGNPKHDTGNLVVEIVCFSLIRREEQWYTLTIGSMSGDWEELRADFCHSFYLTKRINSLPIDILDFEQLEEESIGAAWARFLHLLASNPDLYIPDDVLLNIFWSGLDIFDILDFDLLIGYPLENSLTSHQGSLAKLLRETSFATATSCS